MLSRTGFINAHLLIGLVLVLNGCSSVGGAKVWQVAQKQIRLMPNQGTMHCNVVIKENSSKQIFALTIPETIACKDSLLLNFPETSIVWDGPDEQGIVRTSWTKENVIAYELEIIPDGDFVDAIMTIHNLSDHEWKDVWSFNCLNPVRAPTYQDTLMVRTFMSSDTGPVGLADTKRIVGRRPTIGVYFKDTIAQPKDYAFVSDFRATNPQPSNGNYLVTLAESGDSYMAATTPDALFLFNNQKFKCIHSAPNFGTISPGKSQSVKSRFYFARGNLENFLERYHIEKDQKIED